MARVLFILGALLTLSGGLSWTLSLGQTRHAGLLSSVAGICLQSGVACVVVGGLVHARQRFFTSFGGRDARATGGTGRAGSDALLANGAGGEPSRALCHACGYDCSDLVRGIYACPECGVVLSRIPRGVRAGPDATPSEARENADRDAD